MISIKSPPCYPSKSHLWVRCGHHQCLVQRLRFATLGYLYKILASSLRRLYFFFFFFNVKIFHSFQFIRFKHLPITKIDRSVNINCFIFLEFYFVFDSLVSKRNRAHRIFFFSSFPVNFMCLLITEINKSGMRHCPKKWVQCYFSFHFLGLGFILLKTIVGKHKNLTRQMYNLELV